MDTLPVYDDKYVRRYGDKVCTNFRGLNAPEDYTECESFAVIPTDYLVVYENKYYLQVMFRQLQLKNCRQTNDRLSW